MSYSSSISILTEVTRGQVSDSSGSGTRFFLIVSAKRNTLSSWVPKNASSAGDTEPHMDDKTYYAGRPYLFPSRSSLLDGQHAQAREFIF